MSRHIAVSLETVAFARRRRTSAYQLRFAIVALVMLWSLPLRAATLTWDPNANGSLTDVSGNWDTLTGNWWTGSADQAWVNANNDTAQFGTGSGGVNPFTVTLTQPIQAGGLIFQNQNYTVAGNTLTLGGATATITTNANGTISSAINGSALMLKQGAGTLTLTGLNTSNGGATVTQGILSVGNVAGGTSLGTGPVTLGGGTLRLASSSQGVQQTLVANGFNQDLVWSVAESSLSFNAATTTTFSGFVWYEHGVVGAQGVTANTAPTPRTFTSAANASVQFQFAPYGTLAARNNNALDLPSGSGGTLSLASPGQFQALQFLTNAQGSSTTWSATLNFSDGSHTVESNVVDPDWTTPNSQAAIDTGLYDGNVYNGGLFLREHDFALSPADQAKTLNSVTFNTVSSGGNGLVVFAMSGVEMSSAAPQTFTNSVSVTADSTIDVQSSPVASMGNLSIGSNKLSLTGVGGTNLTLGTATLSGNPTFDQAAGTTLTLGALADGGTPRTITKSNAGTLTLSSAATSLVNGTQVLIIGGTLNSNQATALGTLAAVDVASGSALSIGASQTVGSLSNSGSVLLNGNTLTVGSTNNLSSTFAGSFSDGSAPGTLVKAGTGSLILTGPNAHTGGTNVSQGLLTVSKINGVNSLGPAPVTLSGGTLRLAGQSSVSAQQQTLAVSGFSQDIIWGNGEAGSPAAATTTDFSGFDWYENGLNPAAPTQGLPKNTGAAPRTFTSAFNPAVQFQFASYGTSAARNNNALIVGQGGSGTVSLATPGSFQALQFLETAQSGSGTTWHATLNFSDSSQTVLGSVTDPDWTTDNSHNALTFTGLASHDGSGFYDGTLNMREYDFSLSPTDQLKTLTSVTFSTTSSPGGAGLAVFGLSGQALVNSGPLGPTQTYANPVTVTADSTVDVQNSLTATMGNLSIGANKLSFTGAAGASLAMGATTLTGNATFDPAAGTNLILPSITDGGSGFGIIKTSPGTLTIAGVGNYSGLTRVNAGTLNVTGSLAHADSAHVQIAVSPTAPKAFAADTPVVESSIASVSGTYAGHGSQIAGDLNTKADILAGTNSGAFTGGNATMTMQWRQRAINEIASAQGGAPTSPPLPSVGSSLISDVIKLTGMSSGAGDPTQTDPFVLQLTYDASELNGEAARAAAGAVYLGWLNPTGGPGGVPLWENAIAGDTGNNATLAEQNFPGDFATFQGSFGSTLGNYIGAWGVDTTNHDVWAVVNHNSDFAVVPEPSSVVLLCFGALSFLLPGLRRRIRK